MNTQIAIAVGLVLYVVLTTGVSLVMMRRVRKPADYLVAGRGLPFRVPLEQAANDERKLPLEYLTEKRNDIAESFRQYVEPLAGGPLRRYERLI